MVQAEYCGLKILLHGVKENKPANINMGTLYNVTFKCTYINYMQEKKVNVRRRDL